jgi:hypothetical protein
MEAPHRHPCHSRVSEESCCFPSRPARFFLLQWGFKCGFWIVSVAKGDFNVDLDCHYGYVYNILSYASARQDGMGL